MRIKQIGNGGAFDFDSTNSSFLIEFNKNYIMLFDCGYNVFEKLQKLHGESIIDLKNIKGVFISHMDDDHMGSLKTFIYYQYIINNIALEVYCGSDVYPSLNEYLKDIDGLVKHYRRYPATLFTLNIIGEQQDISFKEYNIYLKTVPGIHFKPSYGLLCIEQNDPINNTLAISGDTVLNYEFFKSVQNFSKVFHDFSNWDCPDQQVHCCESMIQKFKNSDSELVKKVIFLIM